MAAGREQVDEGARGGTTIGVVLLNLGGPDREASVRPFLENLFRDPEVFDLPAPVRWVLAWLIAKLRAPKLWKNYQEIGGSPLLPRTRAQERALEKRLNELAAPPGATPAPRFVVRTAMRCWHPRAEQAVRELLDAGVDRLIALPLYPQYCRATTGSSVKELQEVLARAARERRRELPLAVVDSFADDARYVAALARCVEEGLAQARADGTKAGVLGEPTLLFSAHGLPQQIIDRGDPYLDQIRATIAATMKQVRGFGGEHLLAFQSRVGPVKWLEPFADATIKRLGSEGVKSLVIVPVSFVSDHIETLHEIDLLFARDAKAAGITTFVRTPALDVRPDFIDALAHLAWHSVDGASAAATPLAVAHRVRER